MITRLSILVYLMWSVGSADPSCTWTGLSHSAMGSCVPVAVSAFPLLFRAPSEYRGFVYCVAQEALLPSRTVQNMCLCWVLITGAWFLSLLYGLTAFLSLKTKTSVFLGQRPLDSALVWGWEGEVYSLLL